MLDEELVALPPTLNEEIEEARKAVDRLCAEKKNLTLHNGIPEGRLGFALGLLETAMPLDLTESIKRRAKDETDIYQRAATPGFDPLSENLTRERIGKKGKVIAVSSDHQVGKLIPYPDSNDMVRGFADLEKRSVHVGVSAADSFGLRELVVSTIHEEIDSAHRTLAHEITHLGQPKPAATLAEGLLFWRSQDVALRYFYSPCLELTNEAIARVGYSDYGYSEPMNYENIHYAIESYEFYNEAEQELGGVENTEAFVKEITETAYALGGTGMTGYEFWNKVHNKLAKNKLPDKPSALQVLSVVRQIAHERLGNLSAESMQEYAVKGTDKATLRHLKLKKIFLEESVEFADTMWGSGTATLLGFQELSIQEKPWIYLLPASADGNRIAARYSNLLPSSSPFSTELTLGVYQSGFVQGVGLEYQLRNGPFNQPVSPTELGNLAHEIWQSLPTKEQDRLITSLKEGSVTFDQYNTDIIRGQLAEHFWHLVANEANLGSRAAEEITDKRVVARQNELEQYVREEESNSFQGSYLRLPRHKNIKQSFGEVAAVMPEWAQNVLAKLQSQPLLLEILQRNYGNIDIQKVPQLISEIMTKAQQLRDLHYSNSVISRANLIVTEGAVHTPYATEKVAAQCELAKIIAGCYWNMVDAQRATD